VGAVSNEAAALRRRRTAGCAARGPRDMCTMKLKDVSLLQRRLPRSCSRRCAATDAVRALRGQAHFPSRCSTLRTTGSITSSRWPKRCILRGAQRYRGCSATRCCRASEIKSKKHYSHGPLASRMQVRARNAIPHFHADFVQATALATRSRRRGSIGWRGSETERSREPSASRV
jgi:hypothetical protein